LKERVAPSVQAREGAVPLASLSTVLSTKLTPPSLSAGQIERQRLMAQLAGWRTHRLTVITAPAGYGKSTLAAQCVHAIEPHSPGGFCAVWLTLDAADDEPAQLLACLTAALAAVIPASAAVAKSLINQNRVQAALHALLVGLEHSPAPLLVVLDDFQHIRSPAAQQVVASAVERSPASCRWMVLTRHAPPAKLIGKLRVQDQLLELNADAFRLSHAEINALVARFAEVDLDAAAIDLLVQRAQGWIAAVHLVLLSLNRIKSSLALRTAQNLLGHLRDGNRLLAEYLTAEVLTVLPDSLRTFLLQCSILDRLHPDLCRAVTGQEESAFLLEQAMEEQLFIRALVTDGEWYELHQLFRDLLRRTLRLQRSPAQLQLLYQKAADWHLACGDMAQALHYLVAGGTPERAASLLANHARSILLNNRQAELRHWFNLLPAATLDTHPQLLLDRAWLSVVNDLDELRAVLARVDAVMAALPSLPAAWQDELATLHIWQRMMSGSQAGVYEDALATATRLAPESALARGWCGLAALLTRSAQPAGAPVAAYAQEAASAFTAAGYDFGSLLVTGWQAEYSALIGDAPAALALCERSHQLILSQQYPALHERGYFDFLAGEVYYWLDRPQDAAAYFQRVLDDARTRSEAMSTLRASAALQVCEVALGRSLTPTDADCAEEAELWQRAEQGCSVGFKSRVVLWQIQRWLLLGQPAEAWGAYQQLRLSPETAAVDAPEALWVAILLANVALGRNLATLTPHFERLTAQSERNNLRLTAIRVRLLWVHQQQQLGFHHRARTILRQALRDIEVTGYVRLLLDAPAILPTLRAVDTHYARTLVTRLDAPAALPRYENLTKQELTILRHLVNGAKITEIAQALVISQGTVKWHLTNLYTKLGVKNQREAVALALRLRLLAR
jgi:LuxR family maltose regulon positive regulatory protein